MILIFFFVYVDIRYVLIVIFCEISYFYYVVIKLLENIFENFFLINCMFDRFVDFVGIEFE